MRLNYKRLGDYIEPCNEKNDGNVIKKLQGISNRKYFQKAKTNTIGIDLTKYRVVRTGQFAFNRATTRNGDKISIALRHGKDCIVSPSYRIFESKDENILNSEYLMMWFKRPDFDRYARFKSHGSAHEFFDWAEMQEVDLPIPSIEKQREIVKEYNTIVNRIRLNETLNQKLEDTAQALYKHWFVDFEFPNADGKRYKSSGGEMVYNEELDMEVPLGWELGVFDEVIDVFISKRGKSKSLMNLNNYSLKFKFPVISAMNVKNGKIVKNDTIPYICQEDYQEWMNLTLETDDVILTSEAPLGESYYLAKKADIAISQRLYCLRTKKDILSGWYLYQWLNLPIVLKELEERSSGTTVAGIKLSELKKTTIIIPTKKIENFFVSQSKTIGITMETYNDQNKLLNEIRNLLLSKMSKIETKTVLV
jgi:type I restriction enzyme S subunit